MYENHFFDPLSRPSDPGTCRKLPTLRRLRICAGQSLSPLREGRAMTLQELSRCYEEAAVPLRRRLLQLRQELAAETDPEEIFRLKRRIRELTPMLTQMNELRN